VICRHCENPPCLAACSNKAISRDMRLDRVIINHKLCVGCKMCVHSCPFGVIRFDEERGLAFKCDLCEGDPECVRVCEPGALTYVEGSKLHESRFNESSKRFYRVAGLPPRRNHVVF
jgi:Fe-S-cluster-containing hydrogenase component 2